MNEQPATHSPVVHQPAGPKRSDGGSSSFTEEVKIGYIKFQNGSRIIAFSSNPYAMAVYGGDVGLDEFAKHPNAKLLWETPRPASPGPATSRSGPPTMAKTPSSTNSP